MYEESFYCFSYSTRLFFLHRHRVLPSRVLRRRTQEARWHGAAVPIISAASRRAPVARARANVLKVARAGFVSRGRVPRNTNPRGACTLALSHTIHFILSCVFFLLFLLLVLLSSPIYNRTLRVSHTRKRVFSQRVGRTGMKDIGGTG